ncbi:MAG TPA: catalase family peroxidase, partial [Solirubrobacteraceae bacterium]|nr:catalase family peroxidase [Solirubrobacteraceae bacterium]
GTFTAEPEAAYLSRAAHLQGEPVPVTARLSNGAGQPNVPDFQPDVRGLAVKFELTDGSKTDIVAQSLPWFAFSRPEEFVEFLLAQRRTPSMAWRFPAYLVRHPRMIKALRVNLPALRPVDSYATCRFYGVHAFRFVDAQGGAHHVRYTWQPEAGDRRIGARQARSRGRNYLQEDLRQRLEQGPIRYTLELQVAGPGDQVDDPAQRWPDERERVSVGRLELTAVDDEADRGVLVFDPTRVTDGIELTGDPVLRFRREAYSESVSRRAS